MDNTKKIPLVIRVPKADLVKSLPKKTPTLYIKIK